MYSDQYCQVTRRSVIGKNVTLIMQFVFWEKKSSYKRCAFFLIEKHVLLDHKKLGFFENAQTKFEWY